MVTRSMIIKFEQVNDNKENKEIEETKIISDKDLK